MKHIKLFENFKLNENSITPQYSTIEKFFISAWGALLYLNIDIFDNNGSTTDRDFDETATDYLKWRADPDTYEDELEEEGEWIADGMTSGNKNLIGLNSIDHYFTSAAMKNVITEPITIRRNGPVTEGRWASWTLVDDNPIDYGSDDLHEVTLMPGDHAINAHGLADNKEYIYKFGDISKQKVKKPKKSTIKHPGVFDDHGEELNLNQIENIIDFCKSTELYDKNDREFSIEELQAIVSQIS